MPLVADDYRLRSKQEIVSFLEAELRAEFGEDIDLTESSVFQTFAQAISEVDSAEVEPALQKVHQAAFLESAAGQNLENLVSILGITRRSETHATGVIEFRHGSTTKSNYTISNGTVVQTEGSQTIKFETTELVEISLYDDFESGSLDASYGGSRTDFSVVDGSASGDPSPTEGTYMLKGPQVSGSKVFIADDSAERGSKMEFRNYLNTDSIVGNLFGVIDNSNYYRTVLDDSSGRHAIEIVTPNGSTTLVEDTAVTVPTGQWDVNEVVWEGEENGRIISRIKDSSGSLVNEITVTGEERIAEGGFGFESLDGTTDKYWDHSGESAVQADARAQQGGLIGNIGATTLTELPTVPSGVQTVTNPYPMGDTSHYLTAGIQFQTGRPKESDDELRERATVSEGARGEGTVPALIAAIRELPEAVSVSVYENKTNNDNTGTGGLPPKSFEVVYFGDDPAQDIADQIFATKAFTARDYGGAHGTKQTETVEAENGQEFDVDWSEPTEVTIDMTLDIVVNDTFIGTDALRDRIVDYVGGTSSDGTTILGTGTGEDIYVDQIEDVVTGPDDTGVIGIGSYTFTPSVTTDSNGLEVVSIGANEVGNTNAQDSSITLNITRV